MKYWIRKKAKWVKRINCCWVHETIVRSKRQTYHAILIHITGWRLKVIEEDNQLCIAKKLINVFEEIRLRKANWPTESLCSFRHFEGTATANNSVNWLQIAVLLWDTIGTVSCSHVALLTAENLDHNRDRSCNSNYQCHSGNCDQLCSAFNSRWFFFSVAGVELGSLTTTKVALSVAPRTQQTTCSKFKEAKNTDQSLKPTQIGHKVLFSWKSFKNAFLKSQKFSP